MAQASIDNGAWKDWTKGSSPLKGPLLALLLDRPGYPYELAGRLSQRLGDSCRVDRTEVYRICERFEKLGLASSHKADSGRAGQRVTIYGPTELTQKAVTEWMASPLPEVPARGTLWWRIAVSRLEDAPYLLRALDHYQEACFSALAEHRTAYPVDSWRGMEMELGRKGVCMRIEAELEWIDLARGYIANFRGVCDVSPVV